MIDSSGLPESGAIRGDLLAEHETEFSIQRGIPNHTTVVEYAAQTTVHLHLRCQIAPQISSPFQRTTQFLLVELCNFHCGTNLSIFES